MLIQLEKVKKKSSFSVATGSDLRHACNLTSGFSTNLLKLPLKRWFTGEILDYCYGNNRLNFAMRLILY